MVTCKSCANLGLCKAWAEALNNEVKEIGNKVGFIAARVDFEQFAKEQAHDCPHFKDRTQFVELPFSFDKNLYFISDYNPETRTRDGINRIFESQSIAQIFSERFPIKPAVKIHTVNFGIHGFFPDDYDLLYPTKEAAEQALRERKNGT